MAAPLGLLLGRTRMKVVGGMRPAAVARVLPRMAQPAAPAAVAGGAGEGPPPGGGGAVGEPPGKPLGELVVGGTPGGAVGEPAAVGEPLAGPPGKPPGELVVGRPAVGGPVIAGAVVGAGAIEATLQLLGAVLPSSSSWGVLLEGMRAVAAVAVAAVAVAAVAAVKVVHEEQQGPYAQQQPPAGDTNTPNTKTSISFPWNGHFLGVNERYSCVQCW